ncbi:DNA repair protein complementing XP-C cells homolog [Toxorhynchites rutilus septentrionalis]|uniref:DNA repair protein complementing XP-C cells homolog n=1 Tax=Toxorhynchites rutilus septentrionalis TaxID=329112 RepID=UPI00247ACF1F|nr:DNA repair protein complementing XP-C cells homolog [Toxorhynchites rutilus septentrionalis]
MNRARRNVTAKKKPIVEHDEKDDDFESDGFVDSHEDFSASEDEWLPKPEGEGKGANHTSPSDCEEVDTSHDEETSDDDGDSDGSVVAPYQNYKKKRRMKKSSTQVQTKRKRLSPGTRNELYKRTKNQLLKELNPELPPLNASLTEILKQCQFRKKKVITRSAEPAATTSKKKVNDDSDSSGDDHLINPEKLDLNSKFFDKVESMKNNTPPPAFDCNAGMRLSDSSDNEEEVEGQLPISIEKSVAVKLINKINDCSSGFMNFNNLGDFNKKVEEAKQLLRDYQEKNCSKSKSEQNPKTDDVSNLLALGEADTSNSPGKMIESRNASDESDWEEVENVEKHDASQKIAEDYQVTVEVGINKTRKQRWEEIEVELYIKRQINKVKRDNQLAWHKCSVLCAIALGQRLNELINSKQIQAMTLSHMQSKQCLSEGISDSKFVEQLMKWFQGVFQLKSQQMFDPKTFNVRFSLALALFSRNVTCKRDYILMFLTCLRAAGVECRLVVSANVPPKRPPMKDLCPISERELIEKFEKEFRKHDQIAEDDAHDTSPSAKDSNDAGVVIDIDQKSSEDGPKSKSPSQPEAKSMESSITLRSTHKSEVTDIKKEKTPIKSDNQTMKRVRTRTKSNDIKQPRDLPEVTRKKIRLSPVPNRHDSEIPTTASPPAKENDKPKKSIHKRVSPRIAQRSIRNNSQMRNVLNNISIPQLDGVHDLDSPPKSIPLSRRLRSRATKNTEASRDKSNNTGTPFSKREHNTPLGKQQTEKQPRKVSKRKLFVVNNTVQETAKNKTNPVKSTKNKVPTKHSSSDSENDGASVVSEASSVFGQTRPKASDKTKLHSDLDSDFEPPEGKKSKKIVLSSGKAKSEPQTKTKKVTATKRGGKKTTRDTSVSAVSAKTDLWIEFFSEKDQRWITVDLFSGRIDCVDTIVRHATTPISYVFGFDNGNHIKDITPRYVQHWNTVSRKLRVEPKWLNKALKPYLADKTEREMREDTELNKIHIDKPLPTTIAECKNHPLYVLKRHLLKYEALYPPELPSLGFVRGEAIFARECVFVLQTREKWYKQGRVVKPFETAYKVVKAWKYDKPNNEWKFLPCDIFGIWQTEEYDPPTAENGKVPRNEYGNVELFTPKMLPKKTIHLQLPGLNKVCRRLGIDCAPALTGFDMAQKRMVPVYDGFVVCEEFAEQVAEEWLKEMEEEERREQEKHEKRVYGNWKRLIKGLLIRRKLQNKYNFDNS